MGYYSRHQDEIVEYKCEQSRDNAICPGREAILRRRIVRLPRFFLVHIKRYVIEARGRELAIVKRADSVGLDESLDFSRWCTDEAREPQTNEIDATDNDSGVSSLFAGTTKDDRIESQYADRPDLSKEGAFAKTKLNLDGMTEEEQIEYGGKLV